MRVRRSVMVSLLIGLLGIGLAAGEEGDVKLSKKTFKTKDGLTLVGDVGGQGETALVFLHGWCGDRQYWKNQMGVFGKDYRVVAYDQAGHGQSGKERKSFTVSSLADDVQTVVKTLGLKRVILVGHSMGGQVSLMAAKKMPKTVVAVIGVDTLQNAESKMPEEVRKKFFAAFEADFKGTMQMGFEGLVNEKTDPELKKWLSTRAGEQDEKMALALMRDLSELDVKELFKEAKVPVRCINSGGGFKFFTPTSAEVNKKYADYAAVTMDEVGHYPMLEKPGEFNAKLRDVLKEFVEKK